jgi:hypothetical protein
MSPKIRTIDDCRTRHEFIEYAKAKNAPVKQHGKYARIRGVYNTDCLEMTDDCNTLPKSVRNVFVVWFKRLGILAFVGLIVLGGVLSYLGVTV